MRRSIRGTLLLWYALILVLVIGAYGATLIESQRRSMRQELEAKLYAHARALAGAVEDDEDEEGLELELAKEYTDLFAGEGDDSPYAVIWDRSGNTLDHFYSRPWLKEMPKPPEQGVRDRDGHLEVSVPGQDETWVLVGQSTRLIREATAAFAGKVAGIGAAVLVVALIGGWFLAGRVLRPIHRITEAASEISESNLTRRIDLQRTENELGSLAGVLNEAFDRLEAAVERQKRFTADASHELRSPLSVILVNTEHSLARRRDPADYEDSLKAIDRAAKRMKSLITVLLTMARADSADESIPRETVDLQNIVDETMDLLRPMAEKKGVALDSNTSPVSIQGNRDLIFEMATNLVSNAIIHNRSGGMVRVSVRPDNGAVLFEVEDDGPGIPKDDLPHLFERFYRVDKARSRRMGGSGLGLAITKWSVEEHGGSISVVSHPEKKTVFTVRLPISGPGEKNPTES